MSTAAKYDMTSVVDRLRVLLVSPAFLETAPVRVFAIASRFDLEEEAKIASKHTLGVRVLDVPLCEDLKHISAYSYHQLLELHKQRGEAARQALSAPPEDLRHACNATERSTTMPLHRQSGGSNLPRGRERSCGVGQQRTTFFRSSF